MFLGRNGRVEFEIIKCFVRPGVQISCHCSEKLEMDNRKGAHSELCYSHEQSENDFVLNHWKNRHRYLVEALLYERWINNQDRNGNASMVYSYRKGGCLYIVDTIYRANVDGHVERGRPRRSYLDGIWDFSWKNLGSKCQELTFVEILCECRRWKWFFRKEAREGLCSTPISIRDKYDRMCFLHRFFTKIDVFPIGLNINDMM